MKALKLSSLLFASCLLLACTAFAASMNKKTIHLYEKAKVHGTLLEPGDYKVEWSGSGPNVQLKILQGKDTVVTVPAHVVAESTSNDHDGYVLKPAKSGGKSVEEIFFSGKKYELKIWPSGKSS